MVPHTRSGTAFWFFLVMLALGGGWAANQQWGWPFPALFEHEGEPDGQASAPETVAGQPAPEQPASDQPVGEQPAGEQPVAGPPASEAPAAEAMPDPAPPAGQDLAAQTPESQQTPRPEPASDTAPPSESNPESTGAPEPAQAEVAAVEQAGTGSAAPAEVADSGPQQEVPEQEPARDPSGTGEAEDSGASVAATGGPLPDPATDTEAETDAGPSFDIVRVDRDGRAVIAGRATPGAEIEVRSGGQVIDRVQATRRGEWVAIPARPLAPGDQELSAVESQGGITTRSEQVVVVAVPEPSLAAVKGKASTPAEPVAMLLPRDGKGTGRILQAPGRLSAEGTLALMTVSYDESGEVLLSGEAPPGVPVRIYVDNRPAAVVVGDAKGAWSSGLGETLAPGTYTLRLDQLDADGQTVARIETPFTRVSEPPVEGQLKVDYVVVQPGNSLWRIARRLSGKGLDYVHIYDTNQAQIRNPDLIYPGQVFEIPGTLGSSG